MKKQYENPDMEIIKLLTEDGGTVLTLSEDPNGSTGDTGDWGLFF
jgi:hypothetical protein